MSPFRILSLAAVLGATSSLDAQSRPNDQERRREPIIRRSFTLTEDRDRPRLGLKMGSGGGRDTMGILVTDVTPSGPAARAGIEEGDRLQSVNGVNLRLSAADVGDTEMQDVAMRRVIRELGKVKIGDEVELRVYRDGQTRTVRVKTASIDDLAPESAVTTTRRDTDDRASLGIGLSVSGSRRDTLGILIASVVDDGPADKARVEEGDRIASINGVDLRVPAEDAGDWAASNSRMRRLTRELEKVKAGDAVELRLVRGGQSRTVRVTAIARKDLPERENGMFYMGGEMPMMFDALRGWDGVPKIQVMPKGRGGAYYFDAPGDGSMRLRVGPDAQIEIQDRLREAIERLRSVQTRTRVTVEGDAAIAPKAPPPNPRSALVTT